MTSQRIIVVGGGMAGVSLGSELALDHDVVLLEAEQSLAVHSTGRSAALYLGGYGPTTVRELTRRSEAEFARLSALPGMPALLTPRGALFTAWDESAAADLAVLVASQPSMNVVSAGEARKLCPVLLADGAALCAFEERARDIDVSALHAHYAATLRLRGGQIVTGARLVAADRLPSRWGLRTADGRTWSADAVVNAAGAWGDEVAELCAGAGHGLSPRRRTIVLARSPQPIPADWPIAIDAAENWYFRPEGAAVLLSPCDETEVPPGDAKPDELDVASALERVNAVTTLQLRSVQTCWAGLRTFAADRAPVVGPHPGEPTLFSFVGQGGYGIQTAPALARIGAELFRTGTLADDDSALAAAVDPRRILAASA